MLNVLTEALRPKQTFDNRQWLDSFRVIVFGFLLINIIELIITASTLQQWPNERTFPSKLFGIVGTLGILLLLEFLLCFLWRRAETRKKHTFYVIPAVCAFFFYYQVVVLCQPDGDSFYRSFAGIYEIILYKVILVCFCPNIFTQLVILIGDTIVIMIRVDEFHSARGISICFLNLLLPYVISRLPSKITKANSHYFPDATNSSIHEASEWIDELLNHLPDGVVVFKEDGLVKYFNESVVSLLESKHQTFIDDLMKLPNKDLLAEMQADKDYSLVPSVIEHYKSDPLKAADLLSKGPLKLKLEPSIGLSLPLERIKSTGRSLPKLSINLAPTVENSPLLKPSQTTLSKTNLNDTRRKSLSQHPSPMLSEARKRRFSVEGGLLPPQSTERESLYDYQGSLRDPRELMKRRHVSVGESSPYLSTTHRRVTSSLHKISINLDKTTPRVLNEIEKEEFADNERIAQDQAMKISFKGAVTKKQLLNGEKKSKHSTVGDAIVAILTQISKNFHHGIATLKTQTRHSYSFTPRLSLGAKREALRIRRRANTATQELKNSGCEGETSSDELFTGAMTMNSFVRVGSNQIRYLSLSFSSIQVKSQTYLLVSVKDTTNQDIASRLSILDKKKNQMLAMVSHEYRSPLSGIVSTLEILSEKINPHYEEKFVKPALNSAKRLLSLANDILDFHQLENQKLKFVYEPCVLKDIIKSAMSVVEISIKSRGLYLTLDADSNLPKTIVTDSNRLQQIILNLLSNAVKFTLKGGITIKVSSYGEGRVLFEVSDTGIGIKQENLSKLFQEFGKIDLGAQTSLNRQGVGLGLQISNALAKNLNLNPNDSGLRVRSVYGKGTTFSFIIDDFSKEQEENFFHADEESIDVLPPSTQRGGLTQAIPAFSNSLRSFHFDNHFVGLSDRKQASSINIEEVPSPTLPQLSLRNIEGAECPTCARFLIVDDDEFNLFTMKNLFEAVGITRVDVARNGVDAIKLISEKAKDECHSSYAVVLMDCEMPMMDGFETTKKLLEVSRSGMVPKQMILGVTGHAGKEAQKKCMKCGMVDVLTKPVGKKELTAKLVKLLKDCQ